MKTHIFTSQLHTSFQTSIHHSSSLDILIQFLNLIITWKLETPSSVKSASMRLGELHCLQYLSSPSQLQIIYKNLSRPVRSLHLTHRTLWVELSQRLFTSSIPLLLLTTFYPINFSAKLPPLLSFVGIYILTILNLLTACLEPSCGLAPQDFLL